jgi:hypothetical protein
MVADAVDRNPSPRPTSLLTGKFTGNFFEFGHDLRSSRQNPSNFQARVAQFPNQSIRENLDSNSEFRQHIRDYSPVGGTR